MRTTPSEVVHSISDQIFCFYASINSATPDLQSRIIVPVFTFVVLLFARDVANRSTSTRCRKKCPGTFRPEEWRGDSFESVRGALPSTTPAGPPPRSLSRRPTWAPVTEPLPRESGVCVDWRCSAQAARQYKGRSRTPRGTRAARPSEHRVR